MPRTKKASVTAEHGWVPDELRASWEALSLNQQNFVFAYVVENRSATASYLAAHPDAAESTAWRGGFDYTRNHKVLTFIRQMQQRKFEAMCLSMEEVGAFLGRVMRAGVPYDLFDEEGQVRPENADLVGELRHTKYGIAVKTPDKLAAAKLAVELLKGQSGEEELKRQSAIDVIAKELGEMMTR